MCSFLPCLVLVNMRLETPWYCLVRASGSGIARREPCILELLDEPVGDDFADLQLKYSLDLPCSGIAVQQLYRQPTLRLLVKPLESLQSRLRPCCWMAFHPVLGMAAGPQIRRPRRTLHLRVLG